MFTVFTFGLKLWYMFGPSWTKVFEGWWWWRGFRPIFVFSLSQDWFCCVWRFFLLATISDNLGCLIVLVRHQHTNIVKRKHLLPHCPGHYRFCFFNFFISHCQAQPQLNSNSIQFQSQFRLRLALFPVDPATHPETTLRLFQDYFKSK